MLTKYDNEMKIEFLSKSCNESFARIAVAAFVSQLDPTIEEIADKMGVNTQTIKFYMQPAYKKRGKTDNRRVLVKL